MQTSQVRVGTIGEAELAGCVGFAVWLGAGGWVLGGVDEGCVDADGVGEGVGDEEAEDEGVGMAPYVLTAWASDITVALEGIVVFCETITYLDFPLLASNACAAV